ncbi:MAG TPA: malto-oligosyltrehalose synthase [Vicinamibacterales bacterium]|nr:malto-oligosyltrehalose synthase [Vicinamibacterales bacterium]
MRAPIATYRVQLSHAFTFRDLASLTPYLHDLGVSDCYCSPILAAREGSSHGYDISDHSKLNPEIGGMADLEALSASLRAHGLGLLVDFVPNHMAIDPQTNAWWRDVLENGPSSPYARFFDVDWRPVKEELRDKVLLAILGDQYGQVLERGELQLVFDNGALMLKYFDRLLPINPRRTPLVLRMGLDILGERLGPDHTDVRELRDILDVLAGMPAQTETEEPAILERQRAKESARLRLAALARRSADVRAHIEAAVVEVNGQPGVPESFDRLHELLDLQAYRLAYWRTAFDEINYRRFFDVNDLAGLRMEDPRVFAATHALLLDLVEQGHITGIRLDHPDGLFDPTAYFESLAAAVAERVAAGRAGGAGSTGWDQDVHQPHPPNPPGSSRLYTLVEKILGRGEQLRESWPVHGTTGYNALNTINALFVHPERLLLLRRLYRQFTGYRKPAPDTEYSAKRLMMRTAMASELNVLARALNRISETDRRYRDFTLNSLRRALMEVIACFPVYRTYVSAQGATDEDVAVVDTAISDARRRNPVQEPSIFEFIREVLLPPRTGADTSIDRWRDRLVAFAHKFQQYTAPVVAKGVEDTAFYTDVLLISANEVGGDLRHRARSIGEFHQENLHRLTQWPLEMTAASTHDTKRGEDARARINVISELPEEWRTHVSRWSVINAAARNPNGSAGAPDRNDEWLYYQALVGAWPAEKLGVRVPAAAADDFVERMAGYMRKALKEAKRHTSWVQENQEYETAMQAFVETTLTGETAGRFLASFVPFQRRLAWFGMLNSLSQLVLRVGAPGVPDTYQGSELWNFSLVDPDNRQPVDFDGRRAMLAKLPSTPLAEMLDDWPDGRVKMYTLMRSLRFRRDHPDLFLHGDYEPLSGEADDPHVIAFSRRRDDQELIVVVPRFLAAMMGGVPGTPLGAERWKMAGIRLPRRLARARLLNVFTNEMVEPLVHRDVSWLLVATALQSWPVAMLHVR